MFLFFSRNIALPDNPLLPFLAKIFQLYFHEACPLLTMGCFVLSTLGEKEQLELSPAGMFPILSSTEVDSSMK